VALSPPKLGAPAKPAMYLPMEILLEVTGVSSLGIPVKKGSPFFLQSCPAPSTNKA
jgi:hypothetical protein